MNNTNETEIAVSEDGAHIIENMPPAQYHARPEISAHGLMRMLQAPALYVEDRTNPKEPTKDMWLGTQIHKAVLEPERFAAETAISPEGINRSTKDGKAAWAKFLAENVGKDVMDADDYATIVACAKSVLNSPNHTRAARLLHPTAFDGINEGSMFWTGHAGQRCKGRFDRFLMVSEDRPVIVDLKKMQDVSDKAMQSTITDRLYFVQAAFYVDGFAMCRPDLPAPSFVIVGVEAKSPYLVNQKRLSDMAISEGRRLYRKAIELLLECKVANTWPGYPDIVAELDLSPWYRG